MKTGFLHNKDGYIPKKDIVTGIIEKIRAELLEDGEISEEAIALAALMDLRRQGKPIPEIKAMLNQ